MAAVAAMAAVAVAGAHVGVAAAAAAVVCLVRLACGLARNLDGDVVVQKRVLLLVARDRAGCVAAVEAVGGRQQDHEDEEDCACCDREQLAVSGGDWDAHCRMCAANGGRSVQKCV